MSAALVVTNATSADRAFSCGVFVNPNNISFGDSRDVKINNFVYRLFKDEAIKPEEIGMGAVVRKDLNVSLDSMVKISSFTPNESDADQEVMLVEMEVSYFGNVDSEKGGTFFPGYLEKRFAANFEGRYMKVGQTFIIKTFRDLIMKFKVTSMAGAIYENGEPAFSPHEEIVQGLCPCNRKISIHKAPQSNYIIFNKDIQVE